MEVFNNLAGAVKYVGFYLYATTGKLSRSYIRQSTGYI